MENSYSMATLIEALQILQKYDRGEYPIICENRTLFIPYISPEVVSGEDLESLAELGFHPTQNNLHFESLVFG